MVRPCSQPRRDGRLRVVSHPSLGLPRPAAAGFPDAAARVRAARGDLGVRALEAAIERDPTLRDRLGEEGLRRLLRDTDIFLVRIALAIESGDPQPVRGWTEWVVPVYRRRRVPLDDIATLAEGLRTALGGVLSAEERVPADEAIDESIAVLRWHRRLGGDARDRGRLLNALYKGA
jgi:hypothetical protein